MAFQAPGQPEIELLPYTLLDATETRIHEAWKYRFLDSHSCDTRRKEILPIDKCQSACRVIYLFNISVEDPPLEIADLFPWIYLAEIPEIMVAFE